MSTRCQYVSLSPWGPTQCALADGHDGRHAYSPSESISTHDRWVAFLDTHEREHSEDGTRCTNLCLAAALASETDQS